MTQIKPNIAYERDPSLGPPVFATPLMVYYLNNTMLVYFEASWLVANGVEKELVRRNRTTMPVKMFMERYGSSIPRGKIEVDNKYRKATSEMLYRQAS